MCYDWRIVVRKICGTIAMGYYWGIVIEKNWRIDIEKFGELWARRLENCDRERLENFNKKESGTIAMEKD